MLNFKKIDEIIIDSLLDNLKHLNDFTDQYIKPNSQKDYWFAFFAYHGDCHNKMHYAFLKSNNQKPDLSLNEQQFNAIILGEQSKLLGCRVPMDIQDAWKLICELEDTGFILRKYTQDFIHYAPDKTTIYLNAIRTTCETN